MRRAVELPKNNYTISIDSDLMKKFKKDCKLKDLKYSNKIEELIDLHLKDDIVSISSGGVALDNVKDSIESFKSIVAELDKVLPESKESNEEDWG